MINLCEVCGKNMATTGSRGVKLCRDCFHTIRTERDSDLSVKFMELAESKSSTAQERAWEQVYETYLAASKNKNNDEAGQSQNASRLRFRSFFFNALDVWSSTWGFIGRHGFTVAIIVGGLIWLLSALSGSSPEKLEGVWGVLVLCILGLIIVFVLVGFILWIVTSCFFKLWDVTVHFFKEKHGG